MYITVSILEALLYSRLCYVGHYIVGVFLFFVVVVYRYWSEGKETWPRMLPVVSMVAKVLGSGALEAYGHPQLTVLDAMRMEERDSYISLLKQSSTALVNAYRREGFPYPPWRVKTLFIQSLVSQQATAAQAFDLPTRHVHNQPGIYKTERGTSISLPT